MEDVSIIVDVFHVLGRFNLWCLLRFRHLGRVLGDIF